MELRQLKYFMAVAEERHFGRAAQRMNISQPPLSMQIRNLEDELGVKLFHRTSRRVELTEAGALFLNEIRPAVQRLESAVETVRQLGQGQAGRLSLGFVGSAMETALPEVILEFQTTYPGVTLNLEEALTRQQLDTLHSGDLDIGIMRLFDHDLSGLSAELFVRQSYSLAIPKDHPLARSGKIRLSELQGQPLIMYPRHQSPKLYDRMLAGFTEAGFSPNLVQQVTTKKTTLALVAAGVGMALVPESASSLRTRGITFRPVIGNLPPVEFFAVWNPTRTTPAMNHFLEIFRRYRDYSFKD